MKKWFPASQTSPPSTVLGQDHGVFDERRIGMARVGEQAQELEAAALEGLAVGLELVERLRDVGHAEVDRGQAVGEVGGGGADDGAAKHRRGDSRR